MTSPTEVLSRLQPLVDASDAAGVASLCLEVGTHDLISMRTEIREWFEDRVNGPYRNDNPFETQVSQGSAAVLAVLASSRTIHQAASALDSPMLTPNIDLSVAMLAELRPRFLPKFANRLTKNEWVVHWRLGYALVRAGLSQKPTDPRYLEQLVGHLYPVASTLRSDPDVMDDVWQVLTAGGPGMLPSSRWRLPSGTSNLAISAQPEEQCLSTGLIALTAEGVVDRNRLIDSALAALQRHATWPKLQWNVDLLDEMEISAEERSHRGESIAALLRSPISPIVRFAQRECRALLADEAFRPDTFLPHADAPFFVKTKAVAVEQISLLQEIGSDTAWLDEAALRLGPALGHERSDVQGAAISALEDWWASLNASTHEQLHEYAQLATPSSQERWRSVTGTEGTDAPEQQQGTVWQPPVRPPMPAALDNDGLVLALAAMLERTADPMVIERVFEAALRIAGMPVVDRRHLLDPIAARSRSANTYGTLDAWAVHCIAALMGESPDRMYGWKSTITPAYLDELLRAIRSGVSRRYAALPDHSDGSIDPASIPERLANSSVGPIEQLVCRLRGDVRHEVLRLRDIEWSPDNQFSQGHHYEDPLYSVRTSLELDVDLAADPTAYAPGATDELLSLHGLDNRHYLTPDYMLPGAATAWSLTITPHHPDLTVVTRGHDLHDGVEKEPGTFIGSSLPDLLNRIADPDQHPGELGALLLALGLSAKPAHAQLAGIDAFVSATSTSRVPPGAVADALVRLGRAQKIKLSRVARSLSDIREFNPGLAQEMASHLLSELVEQRDSHAIATVLCDTVPVAGSIVVPEHVRAIGASKGPSKLQLEIRRLLELNT